MLYLLVWYSDQTQLFFCVNCALDSGGLSKTSVSVKLPKTLTLLEKNIHFLPSLRSPLITSTEHDDNMNAFGTFPTGDY